MRLQGMSARPRPGI